jgi:hypothetical protein
MLQDDAVIRKIKSKSPQGSSSTLAEMMKTSPRSTSRLRLVRPCVLK